MKSHLKSIAAPKTWAIKRKRHKFIARPKPGKKFFYSASLGFVLRFLLKHAKTSKEIKHILNTKEVLVDGKRRKSLKYPVGLMDVVEIPTLKEKYRMMISSRGKLFMEKSESSFKPCKIVGKKLHKGKHQISFFDGRTMLVEDATKFKSGDSLELDISKKIVKRHLKLDKGAKVVLIGGRNIGCTGKVVDITEKIIVIKTKDGSTLQTLKKYAYVVGDGDES